MSSDLPENMDDAIKQAALEPKQVTGDQGSVTNQNIRDMIEADKYLRSRDSGKSKKKTLRGLFTRMSPPSARG